MSLQYIPMYVHIRFVCVLNKEQSMNHAHSLMKLVRLWWS